MAREAVARYLETGDVPAFEGEEPELNLRQGCFVTLWKKGKLRGCVGTFETGRSIGENVLRMAVASASQDTRFPPVTRQEWKEISIEISVLGDLKKIWSIEEIEIGRHGVHVQSGFRSGTYLPEVAVQQQWSREEFVTYCAREKAGLSPEECAEAEVSIYEVEKFSEEPSHG